MIHKPLYLALLVLLFAGILGGCSTQGSTPDILEVDLNNLQPLPTLSEEVLPLRVAIAAVISPEGTLESYSLLLNYLEKELGRPIELQQRRTYAEVNDLVRTGDVDLAFVCTSAYIVGKREFDMQLLVAPQVNGESYYRSILIVPAGSSASSMEDLRGKVFAFTDPMSFSGRMYPTYILKEMGESPKTFFQHTFFTYSHDDSIHAVAQGLTDGASVDSLVLDFAFALDPSLEDKIKIIDTSPPFGIPPVVVGADTRPQLKNQLEEIFLNMHQDPEGMEALQQLMVDRFTIVPSSLYDAIEEIENQVSEELNLP